MQQTQQKFADMGLGGSPTIVDQMRRSGTATDDAKAIHDALWNPSKQALIDRLCTISNRQRQEIRDEYEKLYKMDATLTEDQLLKDIRGQLSGHFQQIILALVLKFDEFDAHEIRKAVKGIGTDEASIIEVLCTRTPDQIKAMIEVYGKCFKGRTAKGDLHSDTSGDFKDFLTHLLLANRDDPAKPVDPELAKNDAKRLYDAGPARLGTKESEFYEIFLQRNFFQIRETVRNYDENNRKSMKSMIKSEFSGHASEALNTVVDIAMMGLVEFFAQKLIPGKKTNDRRIIRTIVSRSEIDLGEILQKFQQINGSSFEKFINENFSGIENQDFKAALLAIVKGNRNV